MIEQFIANPKKLFLIDGLGALLSAFLLGIVLVQFENVFGIPSTTLYILASLPLFFAAYDAYCYRKKKEKMGPLLKGIALINLAYCFLSLGLALYHLEKITLFGWIYILVEILIVAVLAIIELKVANKLN